MPAEPAALRLLVAGGTIAMSDSPARPSLEVIEELQRQAGDQVDAEAFATVPSVQFSAANALALCQRAVEIGREGTALVVTHGTDLLEDRLPLRPAQRRPGPRRFTDAMRTASAPLRHRRDPHRWPGLQPPQWSPRPLRSATA
jgi:L-asparaginase/Glu-tRNA(Gln) amidotransferase subunit D